MLHGDSHQDLGAFYGARDLSEEPSLPVSSTLRVHHGHSNSKVGLAQAPFEMPQPQRKDNIRVFPTNAAQLNDSPLYMPNKQIIRRYGEGSLVLIRSTQQQSVEHKPNVDVKRRLSYSNSFKSRYDQSYG